MKGVICVQILSEIQQTATVEFTHLSQLLCSNSRNDTPALQQNVSMATVRGAVRPSITCLGHITVLLNCKFYIGIPAYPII